MTPWPGAYCFLGKRRLKIISAHPLCDVTHQENPGMVLESFPGELRVACNHGAVLVTELQSASGKRMRTWDFLRGNPIEPGTLIT